MGIRGSDEIKLGAHSSAMGEEFDEIRFPKWPFAAHIIKYEQFLNLWLRAELNYSLNKQFLVGLALGCSKD